MNSYVYRFSIFMIYFIKSLYRCFIQIEDKVVLFFKKLEIKHKSKFIFLKNHHAK